MYRKEKLHTRINRRKATEWNRVVYHEQYTGFKIKLKIAVLK